jgi:hypothetical protein
MNISGKRLCFSRKSVSLKISAFDSTRNNKNREQLWTFLVLSLVAIFAWRQGASSNTHPNGLQKRLHVTYQSKGIPFPEWLSQFTLCFAPVAAHLLTGIPEFVIVSARRPPTWTQINFFNPMTIVWRYIMLADRRLRSTNWTPEDLAASNAAFWTGSEWDGSEAIMVQSRAWITQRPAHNRVSFISVSVVGTIIVAVQGVQALYQMCQIIWTRLSPIQALPDIFIPLAIASLFRLPGAMWLTNDFGYDGWKREERPMGEPSQTLLPWPKTQASPDIISRNTTFDSKSIIYKNIRRYSDSAWPLPAAPGDMETRSIDSYVKDTSSDSLLPQKYWKVVLVRSAYIIVFLLIVFVFGIGHLLAEKEVPSVASLVLVHFLYISFCAVLLVLSIYYFLTGQGTTVLIPCFNSAWYTVFTILWYLYCLVCIVFNCIEMRRTTCGVYTTYPLSAGLDDRLCSLYER